MLSFFIQIAESFRRFGIADTTTDLIVVKISTSPLVTYDNVKAHLSDHFHGECISFCDGNLQAKTDFQRLRKIYKLNSPARQRKHEKPENKDDAEVKDIEMSILGLIALRGAA